ncbi:hypothetical protein SAMN05660909_02491 [Chitinophaga terrae (ex Kim and Jung 2007)]|uniref:Uncharacterized protein n=2 Tax=Chitinophaga terrae (ex Kim and Jung 2007) TaxID=408074 RepID=A0A1H4C6C9_9BACT|nr:hypothetical protein SAMN05660909_02491 [Chitinophaga terrae (ex Kim and Jung 2007)]
MSCKYYKLIPEVPGELGEKTQMDSSVHPPKIEYLQFIFDGWLGDDLIECFPCFLISETLQLSLGKTDLGGFTIKEVEIAYSSLFEELYPDRKMPAFKWLVIIGKDGDDFFLDTKNNLIVSERCLGFLKEYGNLNNCEVEYFILK